MKKNKLDTTKFYCSKHSLNHGQKYKSCEPKRVRKMGNITKQIVKADELTKEWFEREHKQPSPKCEWIWNCPCQCGKTATLKVKPSEKANIWGKIMNILTKKIWLKTELSILAKEIDKLFSEEISKAREEEKNKATEVIIDMQEDIDTLNMQVRAKTGVSSNQSESTKDVTGCWFNVGNKTCKGQTRGICSEHINQLTTLTDFKQQLIKKVKEMEMEFELGNSAYIEHDKLIRNRTIDEILDIIEKS